MTTATPDPRHDWTLDEVAALFELPFPDLVFRAAAAHRRWFDRPRCNARGCGR